MERLNILPKNLQFDQALATAYDEKRKIIESHYREEDGFAGKIVSSKNIDGCQAHIDSFVRLLGDKDDKNDPAFVAAVDRAFYFAYDVGITLTPNGPMVTGDMFGAVMRGKTVPEAMAHVCNKSREYLQQREHVDDLIDSFAPVLDPSGKYADVAHIVASYALACIELNNSDNYIDSEVEKFKQAIEDYEQTSQRQDE